MVPQKTRFFTGTFTGTINFLAAGLCASPAYLARKVETTLKRFYG
jgi:hypothetical protein